MDFKSRAKGRLLRLDGTTADNNAFVMRVYCYLLVEFGAKGNAMYRFGGARLGSALKRSPRAGQGHRFTFGLSGTVATFSD